MNSNLVSVVFDSRSEAEAAAAELRSAGVPDSALSVIARHEGAGGDYGDADTHEVKEKGEGALKGALAGGGIGALLGIAALAIPGVGPLAAAGAIAASAAPEAAAIGAGAGALAGGLSGLLAKHGVSDEDAGYYEERINSGGVFLSVDTGNAGVGAEQVRDILHRNGGHNSSRGKTEGGAIDHLSSAIPLNDDPNRGPLDRAANTLHGTDDPNRGPLDRTANALDGHDDPNRGPVDRVRNTLS